MSSLAPTDYSHSLFPIAWSIDTVTGILISMLAALIDTHVAHVIVHVTGAVWSMHFHLVCKVGLLYFTPKEKATFSFGPRPNQPQYRLLLVAVRYIGSDI